LILQKKPVVISPNPFYQIYEGAALLAGAEPYFVHCTAANRLSSLIFPAVPARDMATLSTVVYLLARQSDRQRDEY
jgi:aspartate/methionine/tyrosine aminotransferase